MNTTTPPPITWRGMARQSYYKGRMQPIRCVVIHSTAGTAPGDENWLYNGGSVLNPVSCHYYIDKAGAITQFVQDSDTAWHAGQSVWTIDGVRRSGLNAWSVGIELSNRNTGTDPYPQAQVDAAVELTRYLVATYEIPREQLVRHLDISPGRKTDPAGFSWQLFSDAVYTDRPSTERYTAQHAIVGVPLGTMQQASTWFITRSNLYSAFSINKIVSGYRSVGERCGVDWFLALAQCAHETGSLTSWWSDRPRRNPAGLGVTGQSIETAMPPGPHWAYREGRWWEGISFRQWNPDAIEAHLGRLLAYALTREQANDEQQRLIRYALELRPLPPSFRGSAPTLEGLNGRWAVPGTTYAQSIAGLANRMRGI